MELKNCPLINEIKRQIGSHTHILVGFSGGVDSTVFIAWVGFTYVININFL